MMASLSRLQACVAAAAVLTIPAANGFFIGGGLTILSHNELDGEYLQNHDDRTIADP